MGLIERIKSALGLGSSTSSPSGPSSTPDRGTSETRDGTGPTPVSEVDGDEPVEGAQTVVDSGDDSEDVDVTVEHEPDTSSEDAVKGTDTADTGTSADVESVDESGDVPSDDADETGSADATETGDGTEADDEDGAATETAAGAGADIEEIKGIGPAYADRLRDAGVEDVAALASADAAELADQTGLGEGRIANWIEQAKTR